MTTNRMIRDMDLGVPISDGRRVEVVTDGLPLFGGVQLAIDTTLVSTLLHCDGPLGEELHTQTESHWLLQEGVKKGPIQNSLGLAVERASSFWPVKLGAGGRQKLVRFLSKLAKAKARSEPLILQRRAEQAWRTRWSAILACAAARAFASSLLDLKLGGGADGLTPLCHEVLASWHHVPVGM